MAVGAPVLDKHGAVQFCISVAGPVYRMEPQEKFIVREVVRAAGRFAGYFNVTGD
ncbi:MAG: hypothetical protein ACOYEQ_02805 [Bacillota bacterium]|jgi:DNA-binding IclR family transcriptional regulator